MRFDFSVLGVLSAVIMFCGCVTTKHDDSVMMQKAHAIARAKFQNNFEMFPNANGDFVLCTSTAKERQVVSIRPVKFFVYALKKDSLIFESELENGAVEWRNATQLSIMRIPGTITGDEGPDAFTEVYDVGTRTTTRR